MRFGSLPQFAKYRMSWQLALHCVCGNAVMPRKAVTSWGLYDTSAQGSLPASNLGQKSNLELLPVALSEASCIFLARVEGWMHASTTLKTWEHLANTVWVLLELPDIASKNALAVMPVVVSLVSQLEEDKKLFCQTLASILLRRNPFNAFSI